MSMQISGALIIFAATIATSLIALLGSPRLLDRCLFRPYSFLRRRQYDTMFTSTLVHADMMHLLFNMVTFYVFAFDLEIVIGPVSFLVLYVAALVVSHLGTWYKHRNDVQYASLGASGAISGVLFAAILYNPYQELLILPIPVPIPAPLFGILYLAYSYWQSRNPRGNVNHDAHLGGAVTGLAYVALTEPSAYRDFLDALF